MTTISVRFICNFSKRVKTANEDKKRGKKNKKQKGKKVKKNKEEIIKKPETEIEDDSEALIITTKKPIKFLHIEYNLIPGKYNYKVDVVFWGTIAKVYTKDAMKAMKSINRGNDCWITFSISHKLILEEEDLLKLKSVSLNFLITTSKNSILSPVAKKDLEMTFYFDECDIQSKSEFIEAFETDPNCNKISETDIKAKNINDINHILDDLLNFSYKNELISVLEVIPDILYQTKILKIIENNSKNISLPCLNDLDDGLNVDVMLNPKFQKQKKSKKQPKQSKKKSKGPKYMDKKEILIPAESYFTNSKVTFYNLKLKNNDILNGYVAIDVQNLMTTQQILNLNPFVVKLDKIENIPVNFLHENRFEYIYMAYNFCNVRYKTGARPITKTITFNDHHIYFIEELLLEKFVEFIHSGYLIVQVNLKCVYSWVKQLFTMRILETVKIGDKPISNMLLFLQKFCQIYGIKLIQYEKPEEMFGQNLQDKFLSEPFQDSTDVQRQLEAEKQGFKKSILLAITNIKLHELLKPFWRIVTTVQCLHPKYNTLLNETNIDRKITMNTINIEEVKLTDHNPLTETIFLESEMSVKVAAQLFRSLTAILNQMIVAGTSYQRIILIIYNSAVAKSFIFNLFFHNSHWLQKSNIVTDFVNTGDINNEYEINIITGFVIAGGEYCFMFLEGSGKWIYSLFWNNIKKERTNILKVFYNSNQIYTDRIYSGFLNYGGVFYIVLQYSFNNLIVDKSIYIKGHMPEPCRRAFQKLNMLIMSTYVKDISVHQLPTVKELMSLYFEWGVPLHWPY